MRRFGDVNGIAVVGWRVLKNVSIEIVEYNHGVMCLVSDT